MLSQQAVEQFMHMLRAARQGRLVLADCTDPATGQSRPALCTMEGANGVLRMAPFATMIEGNAYQQLVPPGLDDGNDLVMPY